MLFLKKAGLPLAIWAAFLLLGDTPLLQAHWECALVVFAALVLVPLGLDLLGVRFSAPVLLGAGAALAVAYWAEGTVGIVAAGAYLLYAAWLTVREASEVFLPKKIQLADVLRVAALAYWTTGAVWAFCFVAGIRPLGFDPVIVSLTAAHFHVAGFVLTVVVCCLLTHQNSFAHRALGAAALLGMPLVATGITLSKFGFPPTFEWLSAVFFAVFAAATVLAQCGVAWLTTHAKARRVWFFGAFCLFFGAILASLYGLRYVWPIEWINIPNMKIWHGTLNTLGFGCCSLWGWWLMKQGEGS